MKRMFVGSLPHDSTEASVNQMFSQYGTVRAVELAMDVFSGKCKGFGFVEMEGHEARAAIAGLDGKMHGDRCIKVKFEEARGKGKGGRRRR